MIAFLWSCSIPGRRILIGSQFVSEDTELFRLADSYQRSHIDVLQQVLKSHRSHTIVSYLVVANLALSETRISLTVPALSCHLDDMGHWMLAS